MGIPVDRFVGPPNRAHQVLSAEAGAQPGRRRFRRRTSRIVSAYSRRLHSDERDSDASRYDLRFRHTLGGIQSPADAPLSGSRMRKVYRVPVEKLTQS